MLIKVQPRGEFLVGLGQRCQTPKSDRAGGGGGKHARAVGPRIEEVQVTLGLHRAHGVARATGVFVVFLDHVLASVLFPALEQRQIGAAIESLGVLDASDVQHGGQEIDRGNHVLLVDATGLGDARPADHPRRVRAVMVKLRFGKRQRHAVVGHKHDHGFVRLAAVLERLKHGAHGIVCAAHTGIIKGQFRTHLRVIKKETGNGQLGGGENSRRFVRVFRPSPEWLVRIRDVDHETERLLRRLGLRDASGGGDAVRRNILEVRFRTIRQCI